jgi:hypothetical protein
MKNKAPIRRRDTQKAMGITMDTDLKAQLDAIKEREGIPINRQIELALALWLQTRPDSLASIEKKLKTAGFVRAAAEVALQGARR